VCGANYTMVVGGGGFWVVFRRFLEGGAHVTTHRTFSK